MQKYINFARNHNEKIVQTVMVNNSTNMKKKIKHLSPQIIEHRDTGVTGRGGGWGGGNRSGSERSGDWSFKNWQAKRKCSRLLRLCKHKHMILIFAEPSSYKLIQIDRLANTPPPPTHTKIKLFSSNKLTVLFCFGIFFFICARL